ncbi:MAG: MerR family transcriptional regulator, partial [Chloroflexi bacterium]|nr:MerR family transcriptional regulator [Chloroflexota bacterium]
MNQKRYLSAKEAITRLGISAATLYAYVSRGLIRSEEIPENSRERRYLAEDVQRLVERKALRRDPAKAAREALYWGAPVLESSLTLITDNGLYYRGHDACELAQHCTFEEVASLLWTESMSNAAALFHIPFSFSDLVLPNGSPIPVMQIALALASERDLGAYHLVPESVAQTGARILWLLSYTLTRSTAFEPTIAATLAKAWRIDAVRLLNAALILCADHELNVSSFSARVIASAEATPYAVALGGLSALQGYRHG